MTSRLPFFLLIFVVWCGLAFFSAESIYWRDSPEFVLSALSLDIPHPAGFPTFVQLSNLFALFPVGSVAWRVNLFSSFISLVLIAISCFLTHHLLVSYLKIKKDRARYYAVIPTVLLLCCSAYLRQSLSSEVYLLNALFLLLLIFCYERLIASSDQRYFLAGAFISGLALGNHVSFGLSLFAVLVVLISGYRVNRMAVLPTILCGLIGLSIYGFIPIRAAQPLTLNTGEPRTIERFFRQISDARDRALRHTAVTEKDGKPLSEIKDRVLKDLNNLSSELGVVTLLAGLFGLILLARVNLGSALVLASIAAGNWLFFSGWDPDPWIPIFIVFSIGSAIALSVSLEHIGSNPARGLALLILVVAFVISRNPKELSRELYAIKDLQLPRQMGHDLVSNIPVNSIFVTEPSWFLLAYLRQVERYRDDLTLAYIPAVLYPDYFNHLKFSVGEKSFSSDSALPNDVRSLSRFLILGASVGPLWLEPSRELNQFVQAVINIDDSGRLRLEKERNLSLSETGISALKRSYESAALITGELPQALVPDSRHHLESMATELADLLSTAGNPAGAIGILQAVCGPPEAPKCSALVLNNLSAYFLNVNDFSAAYQAATEGLKRKSGAQAALLQNQQRAKAKMAAGS